MQDENPSRDEIPGENRTRRFLSVVFRPSMKEHGGMDETSGRLEIPLDDPRDVMTASRHADRIEICRALDREGLTPSSELVASIRAAVEETGRDGSEGGRMPPDLVVLHQQTPPRSTGVESDHSIFVPRSEEITSLVLDLPRFAESGATAVVIGFLRPDGMLDQRSIERVVSAAGTVGMSVAFHRAFDLVADPAQAVRSLRDLGVRRTLASGVPGFDSSVIDFNRRRSRLQAALEAGGDELEVVFCGGVRADLLDRMGLPFPSVHASCRGDADASGRRVFDPSIARALRAAIDRRKLESRSDRG